MRNNSFDVFFDTIDRFVSSNIIPIYPAPTRFIYKNIRKRTIVATMSNCLFQIYRGISLFESMMSHDSSFLKIYFFFFFCVVITQIRINRFPRNINLFD